MHRPASAYRQRLITNSHLLIAVYGSLLLGIVSHRQRDNAPQKKTTNHTLSAMKNLKHIALIAAVSIFASCSKNELVEPALPADAPEAAQGDQSSQTTPLLDSDAQVPVDPAPGLYTAPAIGSGATVGSNATSGGQSDPVPDAYTPLQAVSILAGGASELDEAPVNGKASFTHNLEVQ